MIAKPIKIQTQMSLYGNKHEFYYIFFKDSAGASYRTCVDPLCGNFKRWDPVIKKVKAGAEIWLDNLNLKNNRLIDADSWFKIASSLSPIEQKG